MTEAKKTGTAAVLVVDDYADTRTIVKWSLEMRGYRVIEAASGEEALRVASRERPDLILMDLNMPLTGESGGLHERLSKPIDFDRLEVLLERLV